MSSAEAVKPELVEVERATPILRVSDIKASLEYYTQVLSFRLNWCDEDGNAFASVTRGKCNLFLTVGDEGHPGGWVWVGVSDADALHRELLATGAKVRHRPTNYPWGSREVHVEDLDGNVLRFGSANKPGEPFGDWLDGRGILWRRLPDGGWVRAE
jgi:uncharacterized glyoxalase superfamily protein PhnB